MNRLPQDLNVCRPTQDDAQAVLELMIASDMAEYGDADSSLGDLLDDWSDIDLEQDAWLARRPDDKLIGYAAVYERASRYMFDFYIEPMLAPEGVAAYLLAQCEARARERLQVLALPQATATTIIPHVNSKRLRTADELGFAAQRYHFRMQIDLDAPPPAPTWPEGLTLRTFIPNQDERAVYDLIQAAFERPGRVRPSFEQWCAQMLRPDYFKSDVWFLVHHQDELIGAALCYDDPDQGWVRQLGVAQSWRRRGLGAALLRHAFCVFYQRGYRRVALGVDAANANAYQLYESVGMQRTRQYDEYHKTLTLD